MRYREAAAWLLLLILAAWMTKTSLELDNVKNRLGVLDRCMAGAPSEGCIGWLGAPDRVFKASRGTVLLWKSGRASSEDIVIVESNGLISELLRIDRAADRQSFEKLIGK